MLTNVCETKLIEWQNHLYATYVHRENSLFYAVFVPVVDVLLETAKPVLKVLECAILVIVNLGGALAGHRRCWVKHAIVCAEEGVGSLAVFAVTWFSLPPVPGTQIISPIPVFRLLLQWIAVLRNPRTAQSVHAAYRLRTGSSEIDQPPAQPVPYEALRFDNQPLVPRAGTSSAVVTTTTPSCTSTAGTSSAFSTETSSTAPIVTASVSATRSSSAPSATAEQNAPNTVSLTEAAANQYRTMLAQENKVGWGLRLGILRINTADESGSECFLNYSEKPKEGDVVFESQGIQIHINKTYARYFLGSVISRLDMVHPGIVFKPLQSPRIFPTTAPSSQTASTIPPLIIEPAANAASSASSATATGLQSNTQPDSPVTPPSAKPDEKKPDPVPSISQELSVSPGIF